MAYEDFTTYTEVDPNGRLGVTAGKVDVNEVTGTDSAKVYTDRGEGGIGPDFEWDCKLSLLGYDGAYSQCAFMAAGQTEETLYLWQQNYRTALAAKVNPDPDYWRIVLHDYASGNVEVYQVLGEPMPWDPPPDTFWPKLTRDGNYLYLDCYTDEEQTTIPVGGDLTLLLSSATTTFRYLYACNAYGGTSYGDRKTSFDVENLDLNETPATTTTTLPGGTTTTSTAAGGRQLSATKEAPCLDAACVPPVLTHTGAAPVLSGVTDPISPI